MNSRLQEQVIKLRAEENLSYSQIRKRLDVPKSTLSYWLREFPLSEERIQELQRKGWENGEVGRERFRATMRKKREQKYREVYARQRQKLTNLSKDAFFTAGLMLYLGEGDKRDRNKIGLANTDAWVIKFFIKWLIDFLGIPKKNIRAQLHLYQNMDIKKEEEFWEKELGLPETQFYRPAIRKLRKASFSYKESYRHGTCSIYVCGVKKKREVMAAIQAFLDIYSET